MIFIYYFIFFSQRYVRDYQRRAIMDKLHKEMRFAIQRGNHLLSVYFYYRNWGGRDE